MLCECMSIIALSEMNHCEILEEKLMHIVPYFQKGSEMGIGFFILLPLPPED